MGAENLTVVGFKKDMFRAAVVLNELKSLNESWVVELRDAVAVYRDYNGELRVDKSYQATPGEGAVIGGFWGSLIGAMLAIPFTAGASAGVAAGALAGALAGTALGAGAGAIDASLWKDEFGLSKDFVEHVGQMIQPGDSAIFVLLGAVNAEVMTDRFSGYGGTILSTTLTPAQQWKVERVLQGKGA